MPTPRGPPPFPMRTCHSRPPPEPAAHQHAPACACARTHSFHPADRCRSCPGWLPDDCSPGKRRRRHRCCIGQGKRTGGLAASVNYTAVAAAAAGCQLPTCSDRSHSTLSIQSAPPAFPVSSSHRHTPCARAAVLSCPVVPPTDCSGPCRCLFPGQRSQRQRPRAGPVCQQRVWQQGTGRVSVQCRQQQRPSGRHLLCNSHRCGQVSPCCCCCCLRRHTHTNTSQQHVVCPAEGLPPYLLAVAQ